MAQRQGLLLGRHLSSVQFNAVTILDWMDRLASAKKTAEAELLTLKAALVARGDEAWRPEKLFDEWFPAPTGEEPETLDVENEQGKLGVDYSGVEFKGSEAKAEYEELMRQIGAAATGQVNGSEMRFASGDGGWI